MLDLFEYSCPMETLIDAENENQKKKDTKKLTLIIFLCAFFMIAEIIGGVCAGSLSVITDAAHLLTGNLILEFSFLRYFWIFDFFICNDMVKKTCEHKTFLWISSN